MKTNKETLFLCNSCGNESPRWVGRCPVCGEWNTYQEVPLSLRRPPGSGKAAPLQPQPLGSGSPKPIVRLRSSLGELDRVFGGGIIPGSVSILSGEPGIGKSTLVLQLALNLATQGARVLYASGEENFDQLSERLRRLGAGAGVVQYVSADDVDAIVDAAQAGSFTCVVVDSIQVVASSSVNASAGSLLQVRACALTLTTFAKQTSTTVILIGHVTKEGTLAGPKTLEHIVDSVFSIEGERFQSVRMVRALKNRFGSVDEVALFNLTDRGMVPAADPSKMLLGQRMHAPGSVICATLEGTRALLVELQALTAPSITAYPRRVAVGFDQNRLSVLCAILSKRAGVGMEQTDVFVNVVGGLQLREPAVDLAICAAITSAARNKSIAPNLVLWGEVGLVGELRSVGFEQRREEEVRRLKLEPFPRPRELKTALGMLLGSR